MFWYVISVIATAGYLLLDTYQRNQIGVATDALLYDHTDIAWQLTLLLGTAFVAAPFHGLSTYSKALMSQRVLRDIRYRIGQKVTKLPLDEITGMRSGYVLTHVGSELLTLDDFVYYGLSCVTTEVVQCLSTLAVMIYIDYQLSLIVITATIVSVWINQSFSKAIRTNEAVYRAELGLANHITREAFGAVETVKSYGLENMMEDRYGKTLDKGVFYQRKNLLFSEKLSAFGILISKAPLFLVLLLGGLKVSSGNMTPGMLLSMAIVTSSFCIILG